MATARLISRTGSAECSEAAATLVSSRSARHMHQKEWFSNKHKTEKSWSKSTNEENLKRNLLTNKGKRKQGLRVLKRCANSEIKELCQNLNKVFCLNGSVVILHTGVAKRAWNGGLHTSRRHLFRGTTFSGVYCTLYLLACQVTVTLGDSALRCCVLLRLPSAIHSPCLLIEIRLRRQVR